MENGDRNGDATPVRTRDATRTRAALLEAAKELFATKGYTATTLRQVGEAAGVDPALVVRYFGSKTALFIEALDADWTPRDLATDPPDLDEVIERVVRAGSTPLLSAAVVSTSDEEVRSAAARIIEERFIVPLLEEAEGSGVDAPRLRAELAAAALAGVVLARAAGFFGTLAEADDAAVLELAERLTKSVLES